MSDQIPKGWTWAAVNDLARYVNGLAFKPSDWEQSGRPIIRIQNLTGKTAFNHTTKAVSQDVVVREGDILVSWSATLDVFVWRGPEAVLNQHIFKVIPSDHICDHVFLRWALKNAIGELWASEHSHGTTMKHVNRGPFLAHSLKLPPAREQRRIAEALESYFTRLDDAVATLERVQRNLKRYSASVLKAAVEGRLVATEAEQARAEGRSYEPASVLLERILAERRRRWEEAELAKMQAKGKAPKDTNWKAKYKDPVAPDAAELAKLPEGWCWASVDQLERGERRSAYGVLVPGPDLPAGVPLVRVGDINGGRVDAGQLKRIDRKIADRFAKTYLQGGEVLLTLVGTIGRTAVVPPALAGSNVARAVGVIPPSDLVDPHWIENWFRSPTTRHRMVGKAHEVARKTLNLEDVRAAPVALPPRDEQNRIREAVDDHESIVDSLVESNEHSVLHGTRLRQSILKWAFEGRLVDHDPTDEPASRLLERIRAERTADEAGRTNRGRRRAGKHTASAADGIRLRER